MSIHKLLLSTLLLVVGAMAAPLHATVYKASSVMMNTGAGSGNDIYYKLLGETKDGYQIWGGNNTSDGIRYTYWRIDGGEKISISNTNISINTKYHFDTSYSAGYFRDIESDSKYYHFMKVQSQTSADFFYCESHVYPAFAPEFYVVSNISHSTGSYKLVSKEKCYKQSVSYNVEGITSTLFDHCAVEYSTDGGSTWAAVAQSDSMAGTMEASIPWTSTKVRYRVTAYPKDTYRPVVENDCWTEADTTDQELKPTDVSIKFNVSDLKKNFDIDELGYYHFQPTISFSCSDNMRYAFKSAYITYSINGGDIILPVKSDIDYSSGEFTLSTVSAGNSKYKFYLHVSSVDELKSFPEFNTMVEYDTCLTYSPAFTVVQLSTEIDEGKDDRGKTLAPTLQFMLNNDLAFTRDAKSGKIQMSNDNGATWSDLCDFICYKKIGTKQLNIPATYTQYKFRVSMTSIVDVNQTGATEQTVIGESPNYLYTPDVPTGVDDATIGTDDTPVDVYTLAGKLVAKQVRPSEVKSLLESGTYVIGNKVTVVNK